MGSARTSESTGPTTGPPGLRGGLAQLTPASGRPKPQRCGHQACYQQHHRPFQLGRPLLTVFCLKETTGQRLTRAGQRLLNQDEGREQGHHSGAARRGVSLYRRGRSR